MIGSVLLLAAGVTLIAVAFVDMLWTTVAASAGGGPVTARVAASLWAGARRLSQRDGERHHGRLRLAGVLVVVALFAVWLLLAWVGWTLVFASDVQAVVAATSRAPASLLERAYFAGYTMATLGNGGYVPLTTPWQLATVVATLSGFGLATMGITYLVPVVGAVTDRRSQALHVATLGRRPHDLVVGAWQGGGWGPLEHELQQVGPALSLLGQRHLAYPILHYFHDVDVDAAAPVRIAVLDEALTLLECGVAPGSGPSRFVLDGARRSIDVYLGALRAAYIAPADQAPPPPPLEPLRAAGIPTVDDLTFRRAVAGLEDRRRTLLGVVGDDGWSWSDVLGDATPEDRSDDRGAIDTDEVPDHPGEVA